MSQGALFYNPENSYDYEELEYHGQLVQFIPVGRGRFKIMRVISSDPQVFLKSEFQPGKIVEFEKVEENE